MLFFYRLPLPARTFSNECGSLLECVSALKVWRFDGIDAECGFAFEKPRSKPSEAVRSMEAVPLVCGGNSWALGRRTGLGGRAGGCNGANKRGGLSNRMRGACGERFFPLWVARGRVFDFSVASTSPSDVGSESLVDVVLPLLMSGGAMSCGC